jgi:hypothetical protein
MSRSSPKRLRRESFRRRLWTAVSITAFGSRNNKRKPTDLIRRMSISHTQSCDVSQQSKAAAPRAEVKKCNPLALINISP